MIRFLKTSPWHRLRETLGSENTLLNRFYALWYFIPRKRMADSAKVAPFTNELIKEKSPYLLQHAHNPVYWYPWGQKAFDKAKSENKPIFLSVGYSTCHWCHVMEHESFENENVAEILNKHFVSIKVDREERPDVDRVYMTFVQATVGGGGWPMSVWLTPDLKPFYGGTYFPPHDQFFRPGFISVLTSVAREWENKKSKIVESGTSIIKALEKATVLAASSKGVPGIECADKLAKDLETSFDDEKGGFGGAPKFPQPVNLNFLLRYHHANQTTELGKKCLEMCVKTLEEMYKGGIHDHVSQGFHRYSTDGAWHVPHFEKMLYDQGQLAVAYSDAYMVTKNPTFAAAVQDILTYVSRDLSHEIGGFLSAEDADSLPSEKDTKKKEGAFCVWTHQEIETLLSSTVANSDILLSSLFSFHFGVKKSGNVNKEQDPHGELTNQNVLIVRHTLQETADHFKLPRDNVEKSLAEACEVLRRKRLGRPPPHLDTKILTSWNGLMISGYCKAYQALGNKSYLDRAIKAATFFKNHLYQSEEKTVLRSMYCCGRDGPLLQIEQPIAGFVDDYVFMTCALLDLYESSLDESWLQLGHSLQETQDRLFWDDSGAGYFEVTDQDPSILLRMKEAQDGAEPSANSVSVSNLMRLSVLLNDSALKDKAVKLLSCFEKRMSQLPLAVPEMISGLFLVHKTPQQIVVAGETESEDTKAIVQLIQSKFLPNKVLIHLAASKDKSYILDKIPGLRAMTMKDSKPTVYVCQNYSCSLPVNSVEEVDRMLNGRGAL